MYCCVYVSLTQYADEHVHLLFTISYLSCVWGSMGQWASALWLDDLTEAESLFH